MVARIFRPLASYATLIIILDVLVGGNQYVDRDRMRGNPPRALKTEACEHGPCYPQTGNLLIGRENQLYASSTCGLREPQRYCIVSHLEDRKKCFWCDSRPTPKPKPSLNHNISNLVHRVHPGTAQKSWWQSENGKENVYIQLDLEAEFHFTHLMIMFKTFRPAAMLIERSYDFKKTWQVYRYFADQCHDAFPGISTEVPKNLSDIVCESRYSKVDPSMEGELIYRVLLPTVQIENPFSPQVQNLMKVTNLRINFTRLHTLGDDLLDRREEIQEKYYYGITDMVVRGSCSCYGHANYCLPLPGIDPNPEMVHGRCKCTHNTKGRNCEKCEDFYNDRPWGPAVSHKTNACKKCNCNNHAILCHFDPAVYDASQRVSGGVCDGCKHNTMGTNCEQCKPFFYRDPNRDIQDAEVCRPCDCDPDGSLDGGICDSTTDVNNNLVAGSCHCKTNVVGRRCDACQNGFWAFSADNPDGCLTCTCNTMGTIDNQGCNVYTGECTCKRYVTGRDCNQCQPEFWGLSDRRDGCVACDCDPGGSVDNNCDVITGQCRCREQMTGRTCDTPQQQHYTARLDYLLYEAEFARGSATSQVVIREPYRDGRPETWTGTGFMRSPEDSFLEFDVDDIHRSMEYDIVLRYEIPSSKDDYWDNVQLTLIRPEEDFIVSGDVDDDENSVGGIGGGGGGIVTTRGVCSGTNIADDTRTVSLPGNSRSVIAYPGVCLEQGKRYKIRLDFFRSRYNQESVPASILIDSIVLVPRIESIPWFRGSAPAEARRKEYERQCTPGSAHDLQGGQLSNVCKQYYNSIGAYIFNGAFNCQCDPTGSTSKLCDSFGGSCNCKKNVVGRRCDRCAPGTYGFSSEGCKACDCNGIGSLDNFCNATTGQCKCRALTYGRECDQCRIGHWNFPHCQRCDCNGHANVCDARTGACTSCRDSTEGHTCDRCIDGYYGDPLLGSDIACRPCACPDTAASGHSYADRCDLEPATRTVLCDCKEGYAGSKCDICAENYYGNPEVANGTCQFCECSDKVDLLNLGNCDPHTGQCLQCLFETSGDHCETCRAGFYRTSPDEMCRECVCHPLGTDNARPCDPESGQCACYPNVIGRECDECAPDHWKIASGNGCEACDCDPLGALNPQCNEFDGQCYCKANYGGRQCNECKANFWGNPKADECYECVCNMYGAETAQCDRKTGNCVCRKGIGGPKCDECARGYLGVETNCSPCGECFDNWDRILDQQRNDTLDQINRAKDIKKMGATGAYSKEFDEMQSSLNEIVGLLEGTDTINLTSILEQSEELQERIKDLETGPIHELGDSLAKVASSNKLLNITLQELIEKTNQLTRDTDELKRNGTAIQETNVQGALNLIEQAKVKAVQAAKEADASQDKLQYAERQAKATENLVATIHTDFENRQQEEDRDLSDLTAQLANLTSALPTLNQLVCDRQEPSTPSDNTDSGSNDCDTVCGGAGCNTCGGSAACSNGAKWLAQLALSLANETAGALKDHETAANDFLRNVTALSTGAVKAKAQEAYELAKRAYEESGAKVANISEVKEQIRTQLGASNWDPADIEKAANNVLEMNIKLKPAEIKELADQIKEAVDSLTDIDPIIQETVDDLRRVKELKDRANATKSRVDVIKETSDDVTVALKNSSAIQEMANTNITNLHDIVKDIANILSDVDETKAKMDERLGSTHGQINRLQRRLEHLQNNVTENERLADSLRTGARDIRTRADTAHRNLEDLEREYAVAMSNLRASRERVDASQQRALTLVDRAYLLSAAIAKARENVHKVHGGGAPHNRGNLQELQTEIDVLLAKMAEYNDRIQERANHYQEC